MKVWNLISIDLVQQDIISQCLGMWVI